MKIFFGFVVVSGIGWFLDISTYTILTQYLQWTPAFANVVSSMVGVTYVWIVALNRVFGCGEYRGTIYLPIYWAYQVLSIIGYSALISIVSISASSLWLSQNARVPEEVISKILLTPPNLLTNFIFMSLLSKFMRP